MKKQSMIAGLAACFLLSSCEGGWQKEDKEAFLQNCYSRGDTTFPGQHAYCQCVLDKTMEVYPTINAMVENRDSAKLDRAVRQCRQ